MPRREELRPADRLHSFQRHVQQVQKWHQQQAAPSNAQEREVQPELSVWQCLEQLPAPELMGVQRSRQGRLFLEIRLQAQQDEPQQVTRPQRAQLSVEDAYLMSEDAL